MTEQEAVERLMALSDIKEGLAVNDIIRKDTRYKLLQDTETFKVAIQALKKQIPMQPLDAIYRPTGWAGKCPVCEKKTLKAAYCQRCGQRLEWDEFGKREVYMTNTQGQKRKEQILEYIIEFIKENGYSPTVREIGQGVNLRSTSTVYSYLEDLKREGMIEAMDNSPRSIKVIGYEYKKVGD